MKTTDDSTYYKRHKPIKYKFVKEFVVENLKTIDTIYDVGCNNGDISYPLQNEFNLNVYGVDLSNDLNTPEDYRFNVVDIVKDNGVYFNDCTFFLSLYHHILGVHGLDVADDIFFKLLLRTKYLIFDTGNLSERGRTNTYWYKEQSKFFKTEDDLLQHFNVNYDILGEWDVARGLRKVVVFHSDSFNINVAEIKEFRRLMGSDKQRLGLKEFTVSNEQLFNKTIYFNLGLANKRFFAKKHLDSEREKIELENIVDAYNTLNEKRLIKFYGFSKKYGFIYEWLDNFQYVRNVKICVNKKKLNDVDVISVNGNEKYIDFER